MDLFKNRMTPSWRRALAKANVTLLVLTPFLIMLGFLPGWHSTFFVFGLMSLGLLCWPSNKALAEAEKMKELGDGT